MADLSPATADESAPRLLTSSLFARGRFKSALDAGMPHLMVATAATSGLAYLQQLVIAALVTPGEFGLVRSVEAGIVVLLLLAAFGAPTLAVRLPAEVEPSQRGALLRRLMLVTIACSVVVCVATMIWTLVVQNPVSAPLRQLVWVVVMTAAARVIYNFHQGIMQVRRASVVVAVLAAVSFAVLAALVASLGLRGWIAGRLVGEALALAGLLLLVRPTLQMKGELGEGFGFDRLVRFGAAITLSFVIRGALDATGIFILGVLGVDSNQIGYFGLGTLLMSAVLLLPGSLSGILLPRMVAGRLLSRRTPYLTYGILGALVLTVPIALLGTALIPAILALLFPAYAAAAGIVRVLLWVAPFRAVIAVGGTQLLARSDVRTTVAINGVGLLALAGTAIALGPDHGALGIAWATLVIEACLSVLTVAFALHSSKFRGSSAAEA